MEQLSRYRYEVSEEETVTISVTPIGVGPRVTASNNGEKLKNTGTQNAPVFEFEVDQVPGNSHFIGIECSFLDSDPSTARFDFVFEGSEGGSFDGIAVRKTAAIKDPIFTFTVT
jgi:hypothetical protein